MLCLQLFIADIIKHVFFKRLYLTPLKNNDCTSRDVSFPFSSNYQINISWLLFLRDLTIFYPKSCFWPKPKTYCIPRRQQLWRSIIISQRLDKNEETFQSRRNKRHSTVARSGSHVLITNMSQKLLQTNHNQWWGKALFQTLLKEKFLQVVITQGYFELL